MRVSRVVAFATSLITAVGIALTAAPAQAAVAPHPSASVSPGLAATVQDPINRMPTDVPSKKTPWILDGEATKVIQIGDTMVVGGLFTTVSDPMNGPQYARQNLFAFDLTTGLVSQTCNPTVDGQVQQLAPGPIPNSVFVAGDFTKINGKGPNHLQLLDVTTCQAITSFKAPATNGGIETMELLPNDRLFIGGFFTKIAGVAHGELATLNVNTGAVDPYMDISVDGHHNNSGSGAQAPVGPRESGVTPAGDRLIVVGNFKTVAGLARDQIVMINLDANSASVSTTWATTLYSPICSPRAFDSYMRDVEMSPDGSYFVVAATGGPHSGTLCDAAVRWETYASGTTLSPTWVCNSGGDTLWGVGITDDAVYVGGHERWMNNTFGSDNAGQGSVARPGLSALDPLTGVPLKWNPGRNPRGEAVYDIYPTDTGIWIVSDTDWVGDRRYQRPRLAYFPYDSGYNIASTTPGSLPGNIYIASPLSASDTLYRVDAGGATVAATDGGPDWVSDNSSTSPFHNTGSVTATQSALTAASLVNVPSTTPLGIWTSERNDPTGGTEMQWFFPVTTGTPVTVRLYFASRSSSARNFNVLIDGVTKLSAYNPNSDPGVNKGTMKSFDVTSDGTVNIDFTHGNQGNPEINAIEIINNASGSNATRANVVGYNGSTISSQGLVNTTGFDWTTVRGAFMLGHTLFYGATDSMLYKRTFDGSQFGAATAINPYNDPLWMTVDTGSGQTYNGVKPTWYGQLGTLTGMFYWHGRLYYTLSGQNTLFWRYFVPDAGIVNPNQNTVTGGNITWSNVKGMFLDGQNLYVVNNTDGSLMRISFVNGAPTGTSTVVNSKATGGIDWRGRTMFLASVLPNVAPTASFSPNCAGATCSFDSSASADSDGSITSYSWDFGDGTGSGEASPSHDYAVSGDYTVSLTVTDDQDATGTYSQLVHVVVPNVPPTAAFGTTCTYLDCTFDGSTSTDPDGTVVGWSWDFGDSTTDNGVTVDHPFPHPGTYDVALTATDDDGDTNTLTKSITVVGAPDPTTVSFVAGATNQGNVTTPNVTAPAAVSAGDRLLMFLTLNAGNRVQSDPAGITGWTVLDKTTTNGMATTTYTKVADPGDAGTKVTVTLDLASKYTMTVADYAGVRPGTVTIKSAPETISQTAHTTPATTAPSGGWVVSYWADKSAATTGFAIPASLTGRGAICGTSTGHVCSQLADTGGAAPTGAYPGQIAVADSASANATMATVILRTQQSNVSPTASFTQTCNGTACTFDASGSSDDSQVVDYAWDFGGGNTATGVSPSFDFLVTGAYPVTLTVTDDEGAVGTVTNTVSVVRTNAPPTAAFTFGCTYRACSFDANGSGDTDGTIASYAWDYNDGNVDSGVTPSHTFGSDATFAVTLTVQDNDGASTSVTKNVTVAAARPIAFVGSTSNFGNVATPNTTVPAGTTVGDRLVMVLSLNASNKVLSNPTGVTGWNQLDSAVSGTMATYVYSKVAATGDAGKKTTVPIDTAAKYTMTIADYSGDMLAPQLAKASETVVQAGHTTPTIAANDGDWALSYWADKSSATTGFTLPGSVTSRQQVCGASTGHVCSVLADSAGPVSAGPYGGLTATADSPQGNATMWTILLRQDG